MPNEKAEMRVWAPQHHAGWFKISNLKSVVFSQYNSQPEFFACVAHCLLVLTETNDQNSVESKTEWYIPLETVVQPENKTDAKSLLISAAQRVWLDMYLAKKSVCFIIIIIFKSLIIIDDLASWRRFTN